jgi:hypothetical protein
VSVNIAVGDAAPATNAAQYGWSTWEEEAVSLAYYTHDGSEPRDPRDVVYDLNYRHQVRRANRNV